MANKLTEDDISALIDGEANDDLRVRAQDPEAAAQVSTARQTEEMLRQRLYRRECPPAHRLGDYAFKRLPAHEVEDIARHLALCARCRAEVATLAAFLDAPDGPAEYAPVAAGIRRQGPRHTAVRQAAVGALRGQENVYSQVLEREAFTLFLEARELPGGVLLTGQIVAPDAETQQQWAGALIEIRQAHTLLLTSTVNEVGEFRFRGLDAGKAEIAITSEAGSGIWLDTEPLLPEGEA